MVEVASSNLAGPTKFLSICFILTFIFRFRWSCGELVTSTLER